MWNYRDATSSYKTCLIVLQLYEYISDFHKLIAHIIKEKILNKTLLHAFVIIVKYASLPQEGEGWQPCKLNLRKMWQGHDFCSIGKITCNYQQDQITNLHQLSITLQKWSITSHQLLGQQFFQSFKEAPKELHTIKFAIYFQTLHY